MYCVKCGHEIPPQGKFCSSCGSSLAGTDTIQIRPQVKIRNSILMPALVLALAAAGFLVFNTFLAEKPAKTVYKFIEAINNKDINTAMECMDPKDEKLYYAASKIAGEFLGVNPTDIADLLPGTIELLQDSGEMKADLQMEITDIVSQEVNGDYATVVTHIKGISTDENGQVTRDEGQATFKLQKFDVGWRIVNFN